MSITEWMDKYKIDYTIDKEDDCVYHIEGFGKVLNADFSKKKSIFREFDDGENKSIFLNIFDTKEDLLNDNIEYVAFLFGRTYNYVSVNDSKLEMYPFVNVGKVKLRKDLDVDYVNLGVHTGMDMLNGSGKISDWIKRAKFLNHKYLGVCDFNTLGSTLNLQKECSDSDIQPIFGFSTRVAFNFSNVDNLENTSFGIKLYAKTNDGLSSLLRVQKSVMVDCDLEGRREDEPNQVILFDKLKKYNKDLFLVIETEAMMFAKNNMPLFLDVVSQFENDSVYYQLDFNEFKANRIDMGYLESIKYYFDNIYKDGKIPPILISDCYYINQFESKNKYTLNLIAYGASHNQSDEQWYKDIEEQYDQMKDLFESIDAKDVLRESAKNTLYIAERCDAKYNMTTNFMPRYDMTDEEARKYGDPVAMFDALLEEGFKNKTPKGKEDIYRERLEMERYIIKSTDNVNYMLNQYDVVKWAEENDITVGAGRGSAGGSLILYFLNVTKVDPIRFNLLFERFLLPERAGLYEAQVTKIDEVIDGVDEVYEIEFEDGRKILLDADSLVLAKDKDRSLYPDELVAGDELIFDNIHNINDIK